MSPAGTGYCDPKDGERLSAENLSRIVKGLPAKAQMVLRGLVHMQAGCLKLTLPDSRTVVIKGKAQGPVASITLHNWEFTAARAGRRHDRRCRKLYGRRLG